MTTIDIAKMIKEGKASDITVLPGHGHWSIIAKEKPIDVIEYVTVYTKKCTCGHDLNLAIFNSVDMDRDNTPKQYTCYKCKSIIEKDGDIINPLYFFTIPYRAKHYKNEQILSGDYVHTLDNA